MIVWELTDEDASLGLFLAVEDAMLAGVAEEQRWHADDDNDTWTPDAVVWRKYSSGLADLPRYVYGVLIIEPRKVN